MPGFKQDIEETPVLFRANREDGQTFITAVFPCEPYDQGDSMICYAHVGQHGVCSPEWYRETTWARPEEYESLKKELESAPYGYRLKIYSRMQPWHRDKRQAEVRRLRWRKP